MHSQVVDWCEYVRGRFPEHFSNSFVLEIGSLDINGSVRSLFHNPLNYIGLDLGPGPGVDVICPAHLFKSNECFTVIISTEALEHDQHWAKTLAAASSMLCPGGLMLFTCAAPGRGEHGTARSSPADAPFTNDYYRNLSETDVRSTWPVDDIFSSYEFNTLSTDLRFWGIKKGAG